jgi:hypothetical protein
LCSTYQRSSLWLSKIFDNHLFYCAPPVILDQRILGNSSMFSGQANAFIVW